ncbi:calcium-activated chloride channel regulator 1-like [Neocloeon triangulifer]|uniref:calcium-activated chloride channel regulator 1-like n=1 Tax=Neocloeon triangulifer TaxID=2078957 RepID=UPI00286F602B|nr:calcium-activated chloride channel regulator 1-like [Neocloeon triangulifer]
MVWRFVLGVAALLLVHGAHARSGVTLRNSGYEGLVLAIADTVPYDECDQIITNLKTALTDASQYLNGALDGRAFFRSATVLLPSSWKGDCGQVVQPASGEMASRADIRITPQHLLFSDALWTQQSQGCGKPGDFISLAYTRLVNSVQNPGELGRALVREWAKLRYGVFDEAGIPGDAVYPPCYHDEKDGAARVSGCTDKHQNTEGLCENVTQLLLAGDTDTLTPLLVHPEATSSIMFAHTSPSVTRFCDHTTHNRYAPTKHNAMCNRRSVMEVILENDDFKNVPVDATPYFGDTTPTVTFKREVRTRYVLVIEDTNDMLVRESWSFLRSAIRKFTIHDLAVGSEVGIVTVNGTDAVRLQRLVSLNYKTREPVASILPYTPGEFGAPKVESSSCLPCGISTAIDMLTENGEQGGNSVILVIAPGTGRLGELLNLGNQARALGIKIATINYPQMARPTHSSLDALAHLTDAPAFTVLEKRQNQDASFLNSYFELAQALLAIRNEFYQGDRIKLPVEIHRKELTDNGRGKVTGTFVVPPGLGEPSQVHVYLHQSIIPLVKQVTLVSPSQRTYNSKSDELLNIKILKINAIINETGTWTYSIDRHPGSQQPHFIVVAATPQSNEQRDAPVTAHLFTSGKDMRLDGQSGPLALYVEVKQGDWPVLSARVEVKVTKVGNDSGHPYEDRFELLDTGSGDPDITRGDGVYSRYFTGHAQGGAGTYRFEVLVDDNGNTAYTWQTTRDSLGRRSVLDEDQLYPSGQLLSVNSASGRCCGSAIWPQAVHQLVAFQRNLPPLDVEVAAGAAERVDQILPPAKINDLRVLPQATGDLRTRLLWTAPGANGDVGSVDHYEVRFANDLATLVDVFESSQLWPSAPSMPLPAGAETTHTLDFSEMPQLLDQPVFMAIRGINSHGASSPVSNVVRLLVASPPKPPGLPPALDFDPADPSVIPRLAAASGPGLILQVVLPVAAGIVVLAVCVSLYCVMVVHRRKRHSKEPPPSQPPPAQQPYSGPPPRYEAEDDYNKQRDKSIYSTTTVVPIVDPQTQIVNARTLSPYQSWTASQLLHEHERRHSPYGYVQHYAQEGPPVPPPPHDSSIYTVNYYNNSFLSIADEGSAIYGQRPKPGPPTLPKPNVNFNPSLQGSLSSVNSDKKKRNVTMV